jgi:ABC-type phosphate transport system substrate-binding protein
MHTNIGRSNDALLRHALLWLGVLGLFGSGCGTSEVVTLHGAGATFPEPIYKCWFREYYNIDPRVRVSYQRLGSSPRAGSRS